MASIGQRADTITTLASSKSDEARKEFVNDQQHFGLSAVSRILYQNEIGM